jgi:PKD repeat protein
MNGRQGKHTSHAMNKALFTLVALGLTLPAAATVTNIIQTVSPASAPQGTTGLWVTFTLNSTPPPPPTTAPITSVLIGSTGGTPSPHTNQYVIAAQFDVPGSETVGAKDVLINFAGNVVGFKAGGFSVPAATTLPANFTATPTNGIAPLAVGFNDTSTGTVTNRLWSFGDSASSTDTNPVHTYSAPGNYTVSLTVWGPLGSNRLTRAGCIVVSLPPTNGAYVVVDTGQTNCYGTTGTVITCPAPGQAFYGQDSQFAGPQPAYRNNGDGTVSDLNTGLMWVQARGAKATWESAVSNAVHCAVGGYTDWRMPTIKELYSLIKFSGANGQGFTSTDGYIPFIDTNYFGFAYGSGVGDERVIDCQDWSATRYVSTTMNGDATVFGVNFADGRIKGYPQYVYNAGCACMTGNVLYVRYVRGNPSCGINNFVNNGDGTISDKATRLMWSRNDSGVGLNWTNALAWVQAQNAANYLGHNDWRLPNAKELQSILDYTRSPATTASAAINPVFNCTGITNEANAADFPFYWASTTLLTAPGRGDGVYLCFGRAMGYMNGSWLDVHGAGAQRSDAKSGSLSDYTYAPYGYYSPLAPQGDAVRLYNYVRLVRDIPATNAWRFAFVGDTHVPLTTVASEIATAAVSDDARFLIVAGDLVESGAAASTNTLLGQLATWRDAMAPLSAAGIPVYVVRGNHEDDVPNSLAAWNSFFSGAYAMPGNGPAGESNLTYSFTYSNALVIGLDQYVNIHRVNQSWLNQQLAANTRSHLFVFGHEPAFKAFHTDCLDDYPAERNAFWNSLAAAGARVYLCGHDHFLNVARIDDGDGNAANDLYQFVVGTGGSTNWPISRYSYNGTNAPFTPVNVSSITNTYGYLLVEISGPGSNDLGVTLTWKQRTYDADTASWIYVATTNTLAYTAVNRLADSVGDGLPDWWRAQYFGGTGTTTNSQSCATCDPDHDGMDNYHEYLADTNPTNALSWFHIQSISNSTSVTVFYLSSASRRYTLYYRTNLTVGGWMNFASQTAILGSGGMDRLTDLSPSTARRFYQVGVQLP